MSENKFKKEFREMLTPYGFRVHPIENKVGAGMPDLLVLFDRLQAIWIEMKTQRFPLSLTQLVWIRNHPEEIVLLARQISPSARVKGAFKLSIFREAEDKGKVDWWEVLHEDTWPVYKSKDIAQLLFNEVMR